MPIQGPLQPCQAQADQAPLWRGLHFPVRILTCTWQERQALSTFTKLAAPHLSTKGSFLSLCCARPRVRAHGWQLHVDILWAAVCSTSPALHRSTEDGRQERFNGTGPAYTPACIEVKSHPDKNQISSILGILAAGSSWDQIVRSPVLLKTGTTEVKTLTICCQMGNILSNFCGLVVLNYSCHLISDVNSGFKT